MDLQLRGRRALVVGGSRGIGRAVALSLAAEGVDVALAARSRPALDEAAAAVRAAGPGRVVAREVDTGDDASVRALVAAVVDDLDGIDILVNSAAAVPSGPPPDLAATTDEDFWADVNVKVLGYLRTSRAVAPHLVAQGWGRIINVSGLGARQTLSIVRTIRNVGVVALTKNLADELGPQGVNVNAVHPGQTRTESLDARLDALAASTGRRREDIVAAAARGSSIGRVVTAEEVADVVTFLASPRSVAVNGDAVGVGGGQPGVVHY